jgi:hypothetical protein
VALLFMDGFDKYGGVNSNTVTTTLVALMAGDWTSVSGSPQIVAPLSSTGQALNFSSVGTVSKTLVTNYGRIIGGFRFSASLGNSFTGIQFIDGGSNQCSINITTTGVIRLLNGGLSGTLIGSGGAITANSVHYLEWDITLGNSAAYQVWLDGVSLFSGTGDTTATANNTISSFILGNTGSTSLTVDDLYIFDSTGTVNNAPLLTSPRIETTFPSSDNSVQFSVGASVLGSTVSRTNGARTLAANDFYLRPLTPSRACTLNSLTLVANATGGAINLRPIVYSDSAGAPGSLLTAGASVTGLTAGSLSTMPLTTPQSLTAGTQYWVGYMADSALSAALQQADLLALGRTGTSTYASGAPSSPPTLTAGQITILIWGNITLASPVNFYEVSQQPPGGLQSYVTDTTVADEDLYNFPSLSQLPQTVHAVAVNANCSRSDTGARTVSLRMRSGGTDSGGSLTGQTPAASSSFGWLTSLFVTDPNTGSAWLGTALNAAQSGFRIDT